MRPLWRSPGPLVEAARSGSGWFARLIPQLARRTRVGRVPRWEGLLLAAVLAVAAALNCIGLASEGYASSYYAATVRSMMSSWHAFFFASFDPTGFVTVDKPPVGFWVQAAFAKVLGFHGWSILLPQALAGVASVALLWWLVRRVWGTTAGLIAALALAVTPISVVTNRNNTIDSLLVLTLLGATWAVTKAVESPRRPLRWLLLGAALVGLGFNIKMLEAYLVLPALWLTYLLVARSRWLVRIGHLAVSTVVLVAVSLSWATIVDLTPASQRPYVGSSQTNSVLELAFGYNGLQRLLGRGSGDATAVSVSTLLSNTNSGGVGGVSENGTKGLLRLLNTQLGGQIGWLVPLAVVGLLAAVWLVRPRQLRFWRSFAVRASTGLGAGPLRRRRASLIIWGTWFLTMAAFFSIAGFYHRYYLTMLAPGVAALVGLGVAVLWRAWQKRGWSGLVGWALPLALVGTALVQRDIIADYPTWSARLALPVLGLSGLAAVVLVLARLPRRREGRWIASRATRSARIALATGVLALLLIPAVWSGISVQANTSSTFPVAGPVIAGGMGGIGGGMAGGMMGGTGQTRGTAPTMTGEVPTTTGMAPPTNGAAPTGNREAPSGTAQGGGMGGQIDAQMLAWLQAQQGDTTYLVAVSSANQASSIIIETGEAVMALGGFSGSDPILTTDELAELVANGTIRYVIVGGGQGGGQAALTTWITEHGTLVPATTWGGTGSTSQLYDLGAGQ